MASINEIELLNDTITTNTAGDSQSTETYQTDFVGVLQVSAITGGTVAGTIQHSADGSNWTTIATFAGLAAAGEEVEQITVNVLPRVRCNLTYAGTTADVVVKLFYDKRK